MNASCGLIIDLGLQSGLIVQTVRTIRSPDVALVNSYLLHRYGQPRRKRYKDHREWRECIYNAVFNTYGHESQSRKRYRAGEELADEGTETRPIEHNLVRRKNPVDCICCQGFRQGQVRSKGQKRRKPLGPGDATRSG
jgi:hypothetical protein